MKGTGAEVQGPHPLLVLAHISCVPPAALGSGLTAGHGDMDLTLL